IKEKLEVDTINAKGNYLSSIYLKWPVDVAGHDRVLSMGELVLLADSDPQKYEELLKSQTDDFINSFFDNDLCLTFIIYGNNIDYNYGSYKCSTSQYSYNTFNPYYFPNSDLIPVEEKFTTTLPSLNPDDNPIKLYVFYGDDSFFKYYDVDYDNFAD
ncbi:hypothetical protein HON01_04155, partial [Candidatus Woesearchaeota archaeon]|nr:hypothetical protein [Candidatus Woesearchaeota archaeon]